jgi:hypothetical protein
MTGGRVAAVGLLGCDEAASGERSVRIGVGKPGQKSSWRITYEFHQAPRLGPAK